MAKTLYIVDGHWQIFRAYYAPFRDLSSPAGEPTKATYVFTTMLLKLLTERKCDYLAVALDSGREKLARTAIYPEYKANRAQAPEDLRPQIERIVQIIRAMGVPILQKEGAEADDLMATMARRLAGDDLDVFLVSRDKDLDQLIRPHVRLYDPMEDKVLDADALLATKGYTPDKAVEIQTLCGDSTDNVPGVPGVGPKTAVKLIGKYGSVQGVLDHLDELTPKLRENVAKSAAALDLTRRLVTLHDDVEIDVKLEDIAFRGLRVDAVKPIFVELDFKRLVDQLDKLPAAKPMECGDEVAALAAVDVRTPTKAATLSPHSINGDDQATPLPRATAADFDYRCVDTSEALDALLARLAGVKRLSVDTETTGPQPVWAELVGASLAWEPGVAYYLPVAAPLGQRTLDRKELVAKLGPILADPSIEKVGQNLKYDAIVLAAAGMPLAGPMFDTMLAAYCLDASRGSYKLDALSLEFLNHQCIPIKALIGKGKDALRMDQVPVEIVTPYAAEDADVALRLADILRERLAAEEGLLELFERIEMALLPVLADMERAGIKVDPRELARQKTILADRADELRERVVAAAGVPFNPDSPKQLAEVLFDHLKLPAMKRLKTGPSTDSSVLTDLAGLTDCPLPGLVLDYRQVTKLLGTYLVALGQCIHPRTGRVHTSFHQTGTATGRLSSSDPNLQNIPVRSEMGREIRAAFVAEEGNVLISADYSQVELRILAHLCQDETLLRAFHADQDIHRIVAAEVFGVPAEQVTPQQRARAKTVNFGIIYGQTAFGLAASLRIPRGDAQAFITSYKARFPRIEEFLHECVAQARSAGYVQTLSGRRRRIEGFDSENPQRRALAERLAINSVVQGSAADLIKIAMINLHARQSADTIQAFGQESVSHGADCMGNGPPRSDLYRVPRLTARMLLQIHDELLFETPAAAAEADQQIIREEMTRAMSLRVPLKVDIGAGANWRDAK